jgi:hypothetical protein
MSTSTASLTSSVLNPFELEELLKWIDSFPLSRSGRKLCRDFSDGVLLAEILKFEFPKLVDLHNYTSCNGKNGKMKNWNTLNRKVLRKLSVQLNAIEIEKLARAEINFIEEFLFNVMSKVKLVKMSQELQLKGAFDNNNSNIATATIVGDGTSSSDIMTVTLSKRVGDHVEDVPHQMIQYSIYERLMSKYEEQKGEIENLQNKIEDLLFALELKSKTIEDLEQRLEQNKNKQSLSIHSIRESLANLF